MGAGQDLELIKQVDEMLTVGAVPAAPTGGDLNGGWWGQRRFIDR